ncbi:TIGR03118 family protein [Massilia sp. LjRoot122]|uniref:TIGR03118 family protein n=1 Tax=Massilia sp. LjRoot122 TaxID=3342257 RepID=UPI003ECD6220
MTIQSRHTALFRAAMLAFTLAAASVSCGGGGSDSPMMAPISTQPPPVVVPTVSSTYASTALVADSAGAAARNDASLVNPWGIAFNPTGFVWISNNATNNSTLYDGAGAPQTLVVAIPAGTAGPARPTGIVFNGAQAFRVTQNGITGPSAFIFVGEAGTVSGWSPAVNRLNAVTAVDTGAAGAVYKGLAIGTSAGASFLYATDFRNGRVDVYDTNYQRVTLPGGNFIDPGLPAGYVPFGIQGVNDRIYVSYAQKSGTNLDETTGAGLGIINVFSTNGAFIGRLVTGGVLDAPWGMTIAPANFGDFSNALLVANSGDGRIHAYSPHSGALLGSLNKEDRTPIVIDGLWGIAFGNGVQGQATNTLFFTAGPANETRGLYGKIELR